MKDPLVHHEKSCKSCLNNRPIEYHRVLRHDDDTVANEIRAAWTIKLHYAAFIQQPRVLSDARVLVDNGTLDDSSLTYSDSRHTLTEVAAHLFECLIVVSAHHERSIDLNTL